ncbi:hypothetical protein AYO20_03480 [Fonsecaea nubica]|uniref:Uncharacterized protein n=1 Tax=Fonsecaea nubica TaxID=856822 RepID=A0A178D7G0_9EURO|nr:hypothetical protein AYO20_03480 [Fonsecaea nubica]OAL37304.1 hypothetical protein AYO20_03480 [Fonsecaea nubica]
MAGPAGQSIGQQILEVQVAEANGSRELHSSTVCIWKAPRAARRQRVHLGWNSILCVAPTSVVCSDLQPNLTRAKPRIPSDVDPETQNTGIRPSVDLQVHSWKYTRVTGRFYTGPMEGIRPETVPSKPAPRNRTQ